MAYCLKRQVYIIKTIYMGHFISQYRLLLLLLLFNLEKESFVVTLKA